MHISGRQPLEASLICFVAAQSVLFTYRPSFPPTVLCLPFLAIHISIFIYLYLLQSKRGNADSMSRAPALRTFITYEFSYMSTLKARSGKDVSERKYGSANCFDLFASLFCTGGLLSVLTVENDTAFSRRAGWKEGIFVLAL